MVTPFAPGLDKALRLKNHGKIRSDTLRQARISSRVSSEFRLTAHARKSAWAYSDGIRPPGPRIG